MAKKQNTKTKNKKKLYAAGVIVLLLVLFLLALYWLYQRTRQKGADVDTSLYELSGIDISSHNGEIDFAEVKNAGVNFVFIKSTEGANFKDSKFERNYVLALENKFFLGTYHFFRFDVDGIEQANNFMSAVGDKYFDMPLVIDVEEHGNPYVFIKSKVVRELRDMVDELIANNYKVMFYTNKDGYNEFIKGNFDDYPLWLCAFSKPEGIDWTIWQYSHWGEVDGIKGEVDLNIFYGNSEQWRKWLE